MRRVRPRFLFKEPDLSFEFLNNNQEESSLFRRFDFANEDKLKEEYSINKIDINDPFGLNDELNDELNKELNQFSDHKSENQNIAYEEEFQVIPNVEHKIQYTKATPEYTTKTWEDFFNYANENSEFLNQRNFNLQLQLLSEGNRNHFEAAMRLCSDIDIIGENKLISQNQLIICLYYVSIGKESPMFKFDKRRMRFNPISKYRMISCSQKVIDKIINFFSDCGTRLKRLQYTCQVILDKSKKANSILYAFSTCLSKVIYRIETFALKAFSQNHQEERFLLKLYNDFQEPAKVVSVLTTILGCADVQLSPRLSRLPDSCKLLDEIFNRAVIFESSDDRLCDLIRLILLRTSSPWLPEVGQLIGLSSKEIFSRSTIDLQSDILFLDYDDETDLLILNKNKVPNFLDISLARRVLEIVNCFLVIMRYADEGGRERLLNLRSNLELKWCMNFQEVSDMNTQIKYYKTLIQEDPIMTIEESTSPITSNNNLFESNSGDYSLFAPIVTSQVTEISDPVESIIDNALYGRSQNQDNIPMEMAAQLSFSSIIYTQWRLSNNLVMNVFVGENSIIDHAKLIQQIYFLNNGELVVRLEDVIFGSKASGGLALDEDTTRWYPSSIDVNGCLSGIVEDVMGRLDVCKEVQQGRFINFGYPYDKIDTSGIYATDIFRLSYNVQKPLSLIINPTVIKNLDLIFRRLIQGIRFLRMLKKKGTKHYVGNKDLRHFLNCSVNYMNLIIQVKWNNLLKKIEEMNFQSENSLQDVIDLFETTVDDISYNLFTGSFEKYACKMLDKIYSYFIYEESDLTIRNRIAEFINCLRTIQRDNHSSDLSYFIDQLTFNNHFR